MNYSNESNSMHNLSDTLQPPKFTPFPPGTVESVSPVFGVILSIPPSTSPGRLREMIVRILEEASPMPIVKIYEQVYARLIVFYAE